MLIFFSKLVFFFFLFKKSFRNTSNLDSDPARRNVCNLFAICLGGGGGGEAKQMSYFLSPDKAKYSSKLHSS